jgi:hypothetical protein
MEAAELQKAVFGGSHPEHLFVLARGIARALNAGDLALAQIYGLRVPVAGLTGHQLQQLKAAAPFIRANFNPDQPRDDHGRWTDADSTDSNNPLLHPVSDITFGHGSRHVANSEAVENAIRDALSTASLSPGFNSGAVNVGGTWYVYRAYLLPSGRIHVGTYYPW